jgi:EmrB/QacA subfamily drug resistance transporter
VSSTRSRRLTLAATALGSALAFLDTTVVVVALPTMENELGLGLAGQQWVVLGYSLSLAAFYLVGGAIGDRVGLRPTFVAGVGLFALASVLCAAAGAEGALIAGRALQGVGGAVLTTTSLALLRVTWAGEEGRAIGLWTSLTSLATVGGPPFGGLVVETVGWRWVFLINVPLAVVTVALALFGRAGERAPERGRTTLDLTGSALSAAGLTGVAFALVEVQERGLAAVAPAALAGAVALGGLVLWTVRARDPVVPPRLLRRPGLLAANLVTLVLYAAFTAHLIFLPVYLQFLGFSPVLAGLAFTPPSVALVLLAPRFGRLADRRGPRAPVAAGAAVIAASMLMLLPVDTRHEAWTWGVAALVVLAVGLAAVVAPITAAALGPAPAELAGVASGLNQTVARVGGILSVAGIGALAAIVFSAGGGSGPTPFDLDVAPALRGAGVDAWRAVVVAISVLAALGAALAVAVLPGTRPRPSTTALPRGGAAAP